MAAGARAEQTRTVWRTVALTLVLMLVLSVAAGWVGKRRDAWYTATTTILVNPLLGNPFSPDGADDLVNMETEKRLVTSDPVAQQVSRRLGTVTAEEALTGVTVEVPPNTQLVTIHVKGRRAAAAQARAEAFGTAYLQYRSTRQQSVQAGRSGELEDQIRVVQTELKRLTAAYGDAANNSPRRVLLGQQVADATAQLGQLRTELSGLRTGSQDPGQVVTPAAVDARPPVPFMVLGAVAGALLGLLAGLVLLVVRLRGAGRVGSVGDLVAAGYDPLPVDDDGATLRTRVLQQRDSVGATGVHTGAVAPLRVLVVGIGVDPHDVALVLGGALARARTSTAVIDLAPTDDGERGVAEVLDGGVRLARAWQRRTDGLRVLHAGDLRSEDVADVVATDDFTDLLRRAGEQAEVVLLTGVQMPGPTGELLLGRCDVVLPVVTRSVSRVTELAAVIARAGDLGVPVAGVAVHAPARNRRRRGDDSSPSGPRAGGSQKGPTSTERAGTGPEAREPRGGKAADKPAASDSESSDATEDRDASRTNRPRPNARVRQVLRTGSAGTRPTGGPAAPGRGPGRGAGRDARRGDDPGGRESAG